MVYVFTAVCIITPLTHTHNTPTHPHPQNTHIHTRTHNLLQILLDASQEDVEAMCLSFEISKKNCFGDLVNHELIPDGTLQ